MQSLLDLFQPGSTVFIPGATGELLSLIEALKDVPDSARDVTFVSCLLPGMNHFDYASLTSSTRVNCFLLPPALRSSFKAGRIEIHPSSYFQIAKYLEFDLKPDVAIAHVSYPDDSGNCSLGIAADFSSLVWRNAEKKILVLNDKMPRVKRGPRLSVKDADLVVETSSALIIAPRQVEQSKRLDQIASFVAELAPDGASLQFGIGNAPTAAVAKLKNHKNLKIVTGMVTQSVCDLFEAGALSCHGEHTTGIALGESSFYKFLSESDLFQFAPASVTHNPKLLGARDNFIAINSALEVDLMGQANLEWRDGELISGIGGASNFAHGAGLSPGGRSIIVLPSTAKGGSLSRIVSRLSSPAVSLSKTEIDTVVTEHGIADLRNKSIDQRAQAIINIADPEWREPLSKEWYYARESF